MANNGTVIPVLDTRNVLLNHLKAKIQSTKGIVPTEDVLEELTKHLSNSEIIILLENEAELESKLKTSKLYQVLEKEIIGEKLFLAISQIDSELCAQLTGMLLELDITTIKSLVDDVQLLKDAVYKAKRAYIKYTKSDSKYLLGEELFELVFNRYQNEGLASQLTGMLLELDTESLRTIISSPSDLDQKLNTAYTALTVNNCEMKKNMASIEHQELADIIKKVHVDLRIQARKYGADNAWGEHVKQKELLQMYSSAMLKLATEHWAKNKNENSTCRIQWVIRKCFEYFKCGGLAINFEKEVRLNERYFNNENVDMYVKSSDIDSAEKLFLLDVGSCYNPFKGCDLFYTVPIDLIPATDDVLQCDFLTVDVLPNEKTNIKISDLKSPCTVLPESTFHVVVFSLFLEYLPSPKQRWICCQNAYKLLKFNGVLIILTPDSKHATANSKIIKNWRYALANIGFILVSYEKLKHLHCLMYRKCVNINVPQHWVSLQIKDSSDVLFTDMITIPQDSNEYISINDCDKLTVMRSKVENKCVVECFSELPNNDSDIISS